MKKYMLNTNTGTLHITGKCKESKHLPYNILYFDTEDEVVSVNKRYTKYCKTCFKER